MPQLPPLDRARGCLLGLAIGDALGAPLEGLSAQQIRAHYGVVVDYVDGARAWKKKPYRWRMPGLYSDDTQQALALCDVLIERNRIEADPLAELYLRLATPKGSYVGAHRGVGRSFRQVLSELERGVSPRQTGQASAGIGAAMRIAPLGIYFGNDDSEEMFDSIMAASLITHRDIRSLAGAMAVAHAVRRMANGEPRNPSLLLWVAADVARSEDKIAALHGDVVTSLANHPRSMSRSIAHAESLLDLPRDRALAALVEEANKHGAEPTCKRATMGFPPACIPTCLYLLLTTDSFEEAIVEVINLGGDADTTGAILGALLGAHYGVDAIPERWLTQLKNRDGIELRAEALVRRSAEGLEIPDLVGKEHELSALEGDCRERLLTHSQNGGDLGANRRL
ncbi:ADP-ribosylglycohydrolase [Singulisphaera sp. GP187]|uniref:ADP-ribosylglycohydrolase family protein n=1 Tax=Singulisphaera sp. GP187 TaxID=1882752 RepID=UPI000928931C|nr:ADP-ribosylglycohydrolase family protein [Singulisphaera sp. GP187]SIO62841.1 ADP-ribosylglycohydrolase [Singulisphaera sp. GP187]